MAGLKPGQVHSGSFKKGDDPRRHIGGAKPATVKDFQKLARDSAEGAIAYLEGLIRDEEAPTKERRAAAQFVIEQAHGKAVDRIAVRQLNGDQGDDLQDMDIGDLRRRVARLVHSSDDIEGEVVE